MRVRPLRVRPWWSGRAVAGVSGRSSRRSRFPSRIASRWCRAADQALAGSEVGQPNWLTMKPPVQFWRNENALALGVTRCIEMGRIPCCWGWPRTVSPASSRWLPSAPPGQARVVDLLESVQRLYVDGRDRLGWF